MLQTIILSITRPGWLLPTLLLAGLGQRAAWGSNANPSLQVPAELGQRGLGDGGGGSSATAAVAASAAKAKYATSSSGRHGFTTTGALPMD